MFEFDADRCRANARRSETEDLLDRVTAFRNGLEPAAIPILEAELRLRGVDATAIAAHAERLPPLIEEGGIALRCIRCDRPAVAARWGWHRLWGVVPLVPRRLRWCSEHLPKSLSDQDLRSG